MWFYVFAFTLGGIVAIIVEIAKAAQRAAAKRDYIESMKAKAAEQTPALSYAEKVQRGHEEYERWKRRQSTRL